jgi:hypothetical protein
MERRRPSRRRALGAAAFALAALASAAGAEPAGAPLAAPGPCAEPRADLRPSPDAARLAPASDLDVAGSPRHHFTPHDVAAGPAPEGFGRPDPPGYTRDACDAPNAGCGSLLEAAPRPLGESGAQSGLPPGARGK